MRRPRTDWTQGKNAWRGLALVAFVGSTSSCDALIGANFGDYTKGGAGASAAGGGGAGGGTSVGGGGAGGAGGGGSGASGGEGGATLECPVPNDSLVAPTWARSISGSSTQRGLHVDTAPNGDVIVVGTFQDTVDFGGGDLTASSAERTLYAVAYDQAGNYRWATVYSGATYMEPTGLAIDDDGSIAIGGNLRGVVPFETIPEVDTGDDQDMFVISLNACGDVLYEKHFLATGTQTLEDVAVDASARILLAGSYEDSLQVDACNFPQVAANGSANAFVGRLDGTGECESYVIGEAMDSQTTVTGRALAVGNGEVLLFGDYNGPMKLGELPELPDPLARELFMASITLDPLALSPVKIKSYGDAGSGLQGAVDAIAFESSTSVSWATLSVTTTSFNPGQSLGGQGPLSAVLMLHNSNLEFKRGTSFGGLNVMVEAHALGGCDSTQLGVTGAFSGAGTVVFPPAGALTSGAQDDAFAVTFDTNLEAQTPVLFGGGGLARGWDLAFGDSCERSLAGTFGQDIDFGWGLPVLDATQVDGFVARLPAVTQ